MDGFEEALQEQFNLAVKKLQTNLQRTIENCSHECGIYIPQMGEKVLQNAIKNIDWSFLE